MANSALIQLKFRSEQAGACWIHSKIRNCISFVSQCTKYCSEYGFLNVNMVSCRALVTVIFPPGIIIKIKPDKIWEMTYNAGRVIWTPVVHLCIHDLSSKVDNLPCESNHYNKAVRDLQDNVQGGNELELDIAGGRTRY